MLSNRRLFNSPALFGYKDHYFVDYPHATKVLNDYAYSQDKRKLGSYWSQPGRSVVQNKYRDIQPPVDDWEDIRRIEYEPGTRGRGSGEGTKFMERTLTLRFCQDYIRT